MSSAFVDVTDWPDEVKQEYGRAGLLFDSTISERHNNEQPKMLRADRFSRSYSTFLDRQNETEWKYYIHVED